ncbi:MAG: ATP-binding cassette domain-containing protein [Bacteroidetes bacterium]|nr:ATP-binding cassette domain-containing protein [Bacteroidota bacterium]
MADFFIKLDGLTVKRGEKEILKDIHLTIGKNEQWAVAGASGSGKTTLAHTLAGKHFYTGKLQFSTNISSTDIVVVDQQHHFKNLSNISQFYYQQRYNASDAEDSITVEMLLQLSNPAGKRIVCGIETSVLPQKLHIDQLLQKPLIQLSNGENKRLQIATAVLHEPKLLILDNPYIGLDSEGRKMLSAILNTLSKAGVKLLLISSTPDLPECITHISLLEKGRLITTDRKTFTTGAWNNQQKFNINRQLLHHLKPGYTHSFEFAIRMRQVEIQYGNKKILSNINWEVRRGERWSISGPNGAGKSTLLSLVTGDNTKAYSNEIYLFDKKRGSGESIWDIKKNIGYVSPEMHVFFDYTATVFETVASGIFDSIGLFRHVNGQQREQVLQWLSLLQLQQLEGKLLSRLSAGEQRLVLLARALVKNPPLLILDEPCQGLDAVHIQQFREIIDDICHTFNTTLLYVSHYKEEIPSCVTKFLILENGSAREAAGL